MTAAGQSPATDPLGILFTDLDGTLLDGVSFLSSNDALSAVDELAAAGIATVPVSSKTAAEVAELSKVVDFAPMAVVEGGAVLMAGDGSVEVMAAPRQRLVEILEALRDEGWPLRGMAEMSVGELCELTGLEPEAAARAMDRLASEPFIPTAELPQPVEELERRLAEVGAATVRGGRLWHLMERGVDKGTGISLVLDRLDPGRGLRTGAVGDAWNDLPMLEAVDIGFLLGDAVAADEAAPGLRRISETGPPGFVRAAREFLRSVR